MEALFVSADSLTDGEGNSSYYRIHIPAEYLRSAGHTIRIVNQPNWNLPLRGFVTEGVDKDLDYSEIPEVVLWERTLNPDRIEKLRLAGAKRIIFTFDDHYGLLPEHSGEPYTHWKSKPDNFRRFREAIRLSDLNIVPSKILMKDFEADCEGRIEYVANFHDPRLWLGSYYERSERLRIGWGGTLGHRTSWQKSGIVGGLKMLQDRMGDKIEIVICSAHVTDEFMDEAGVQFTPLRTVRFENYFDEVIRTFDIGLAPSFGPYDRRRSNLRAVEFGLAHIPFVGSMEYPYLGCPGGILVKNEPEDWYSALVFLIENPEEQKALAAEGRKWASDYLMPKNIQIYERILWG